MEEETWGPTMLFLSFQVPRMQTVGWCWVWVLWTWGRSKIDTGQTANEHKCWVLSSANGLEISYMKIQHKFSNPIKVEMTVADGMKMMWSLGSVNKNRSRHEALWWCEKKPWVKKVGYVYTLRCLINGGKGEGDTYQFFNFFPNSRAYQEPSVY